MRADYSIVMRVEDFDHDGNLIGPAICDGAPCARESPEFIAIKHWSIITIVIYAGLVPLSFLYSLVKVRKALLAEVETKMSHAIDSCIGAQAAVLVL